MPGQIKTMIEQIIKKRAGDDLVSQSCLKTKLLLMGIDPQKYTASSPDDPTIIAKLTQFNA